MSTDMVVPPASHQHVFCLDFFQSGKLDISLDQLAICD